MTSMNKLYLETKLSSNQDYLSTATTQEKHQTGKWSLEEDACLRSAINTYGEGHWKEISTAVGGRSPLQCLHRWTKGLKPGLIKGTWTPEENELLRKWVKNNGPQRWAECSKIIMGRSGKQCREHWFNKLNPNLKKGNWTSEEDEKMFNLYQQYGTSWSKFEKFLPGRTENTIKNRFYSTLRRIDPTKGTKKVKKEQYESTEFHQTTDKINRKSTKKFKKTTEKLTKIGAAQSGLTNSLQNIPEISNRVQKFDHFSPENKSSTDAGTEIEDLLMKIEENFSRNCDEKVSCAEIGSLEPTDCFQQNCAFLESSRFRKLNLHSFEDWIDSPKLLQRSPSLFSFSPNVAKFDFQFPPQLCQELNQSYQAPQHDLELNLNELPNMMCEMYEKVNDLATDPKMTKEEKISLYMHQLRSLEDLLAITKNQIFNKLNELQNDGSLDESFLNPFYSQLRLFDN